MGSRRLPPHGFARQAQPGDSPRFTPRPDQPFDLDRFERLALARHGSTAEVEQAFVLLHELLTAMELSRGNIPAGLTTARPPGGPATPELERLTLVWTRLAVAVSGLFLNNRFESLNLEGLQDLLLLQKQLASIFHASSLETSDAALQAFNLSDEPGRFSVAEPDLYKVLLLYSLESHFELDLITGLAAADPQAVLFTCIALCSTPFCGSERSYRRREELLRWLCDQLRHQLLSEPALHLLTKSSYMYCSYADSPDKHTIKGLIHQQWRHLLAEQGITDLNNSSSCNQRSDTPTDKPTILIIHEWLASGTAMHRCYATWLAALRKRFHTIGMGLKETTAMDPEAIELFDAYVPLPEGVSCIDQVRTVHHWCCKHRPAIVYYPSIGMGSHTVVAASIRLAPLQVMTPGHPATTGGSAVDWIVIPDDFDLGPGQLQEQLLPISRNSIAWTSPLKQSLETPVSSYEHPRSRWATPHTTQVIISASPMKMGYRFLHFIQSINKSLQGRVFWHIFLADSRGALHLKIQRCVQGLLGEACRVYPHLGYADYVQALRVGDLFLAPFPFGNANTYFDYAHAELVGACLRGSELQSAGDAPFLERLGFPPELITSSEEQYQDIAHRLISDPTWRLDLYERIYGTGSKQHLNFTTGDPSLFCDALHDLYFKTSSTAA